MQGLCTRVIEMPCYTQIGVVADAAHMILSDHGPAHECQTGWATFYSLFLQLQTLSAHFKALFCKRVAIVYFVHLNYTARPICC